MRRRIGPRALSLKQKNEAEFLPQMQPTKGSQQLQSKHVTTTSSEPKAASPPSRSTPAAPKQPSKELEQFTNIQEVGVDEPDHVKIGPDNIYVLRGLEIQVASRGTLKHRGLVQLQNITRAKKLLINAQHLFVLGELEEKICNDGAHGQMLRKPAERSTWGMRSIWNHLVPDAHALAGDWRREHQREEIMRARCFTRPETVVQAFKLRRDGTPELVRSWLFKGPYVDARMTAGRIVLVFQQRLNLVPQVSAVLDNPAAPLTQPVPEKPIQLDTPGKSTLLACDAIYRSDMSDQDYRLTKVVAIDANVLTDTPKQAGFVGGGDQIYMSTENLYLAKVGRRWIPWKSAANDQKSAASRAREMRDSLAITQIGFSPDSGEIADIARGEEIRSLRYIGKWAYAVTFKKTDPLFAVDLSDPLAPRIVGELKIPGFSTYMHPVGEGRLIGIGFDVNEETASSGADAVKFQGIKLSLFDISDPRNMRELDTLVFGDRGSYSDVTGDHHAFFYDAQLGRLAFPLTLLKGTSKTEKWQNTRHIDFAGAVLVQIGGSKLKQVTRWRHNRWIPVTCYQEMQKGRWWEAKTESQDINRIYRVGDQYLTASRYGLKTYPVKTPQRTMHELHFPGEFADCGIGRAQ